MGKMNVSKISEVTAKYEVLASRQGMHNDFLERAYNILDDAGIDRSSVKTGTHGRDWYWVSFELPKGDLWYEWRPGIVSPETQSGESITLRRRHRHSRHPSSPSSFGDALVNVYNPAESSFGDVWLSDQDIRNAHSDILDVIEGKYL